MSREKDLKKLEKNSNKKLLALLLFLLLQSKSQEQYISNLKKSTKSIVLDINNIREESYKLADKHSEAPIANPSNKKRNLIVASAALYLLSKIAKNIHISEKTTYEEKVKEAIDNTKPEIERLVVTEIFQANNQKYVLNNKGKRFKWNAELDKRTCPKCSSLDGKIFDTQPEELPPLHSHCRCLLDII